jgi:hypothetical protein
MFSTAVLPVSGILYNNKDYLIEKHNVDLNFLPEGIYFYQLDYIFKDGECEDSYIGKVVVDKTIFTSQYNYSTGYLNIWTPLGWVVQNWMISSEEENNVIPFAECKFNLREGPPCGIDVKFLDVFMVFSDEPKTSFTGGPVYEGDVKPGKEKPICYTTPPPKIYENISWSSEHSVSCSLPQQYIENVQAAKSQCGPAAVANSLQYLENRFPDKVNIIHDNVLGIGNLTDGLAYPDNSLVAYLDLAMNRNNFGNREYGDGVTIKQFLEGKIRYLDSYNTDNNMFGQSIGVMHQCTSDLTENVIIGGTTSIYKGKVSTSFIFEHICRGSDVEIAVPAGTCGEGHVVQVIGAGYIDGFPFIRHFSDLEQTHVDPNDENGTKTERWDILEDHGNGDVYTYGNGFYNGSKVQLIVVQFPNDPPSFDMLGPRKVVVGREEWWSLLGCDSTDDDLFFKIDWGDGSNISWIGPYPAGNYVNVSHIYNTMGFYEVSAKVKDFFGVESDWSSFIVNVPRDIHNLNSLFFIFKEKFPIFSFILKNLFKMILVD